MTVALSLMCGWVMVILDVSTFLNADWQLWSAACLATCGTEGEARGFADPGLHACKVRLASFLCPRYMKITHLCILFKASMTKLFQTLSKFPFLPLSLTQKSHQIGKGHFPSICSYNLLFLLFYVIPLHTRVLFYYWDWFWFFLKKRSTRCFDYFKRVNVGQGRTLLWINPLCSMDPLTLWQWILISPTSAPFPSKCFPHSKENTIWVWLPLLTANTILTFICYMLLMLRAKLLCYKQW